MEKTQHTNLLIYTPEITPRISYAFELIFQRILGINVSFTTDPEEYFQSDLPKINYSQTNICSGLFLKAHSILFDKSIEIQTIDVVEYRQLTLFFPTSEDSFLPFDPLACAFYLVTRYEEYFTGNTDKHGRFADSENLLVKLGIHQKPVVDLMAYWIAEHISGKFQEFKIPKRNFRFLTSIDIDNAWAYKNKSLIVSAGAILKAVARGQFKELRHRFSVLFGRLEDPYDTYDYIFETFKGLQNRLLFFILIGNRNRYDKNISHRNRQFRKLITHLSSLCEIGIHPSYASNHKPNLLETEKNRLENIIGKTVTHSRQHFLKLRMPQTYQQLIKSGISDDYTMGFSSLVGFRAGTCTPFHFFDLCKNRSTELLIHPFQVMDVSLKNYLRLNPANALQLIEKLMIEVYEVHGTFTCLWHNESLSNLGLWLGWRKVFEQILEKGLILEHGSAGN